jgi:hypothetical protein
MKYYQSRQKHKKKRSQKKKGEQKLMLKTNEPTSNLMEENEILPITSKIQGEKMKRRKLIVKKKYGRTSVWIYYSQGTDEKG